MELWLDEEGMMFESVLEMWRTAVPSLPNTKIMVAVQCPVWHCTVTFQKVKGFYGTSHYSFIVFIRLVNVVWSSSCVL